MNILLISNQKRDEQNLCAISVAKACALGGAKVYAFEELAKKMGQIQVCTMSQADFEVIDAAIVLGGDGTILNSLRKIGWRQIPILGVNLGHVGYLTQVGKDGAEQAAKRLIGGDFEIKNRLALQADIVRDGRKVCTLHALNEISLHRGGSPNVIKIAVKINGCDIDTFFADGMLVCTPTGSTAYNLSAGGPVAQPSAEIMMITPICAHNLANPSIVTGADDTVTLTLKKSAKHAGVLLSADSTEEYMLQEGDQVCVTKAACQVKLVRWGEDNFYQVLRDKLYHRK